MKAVAASADGIAVHFEVEGAGAPALVFVHGWSCDRTYWGRQIPYFARSYRVVAIDLAGHGESGADRQVWTIPAFGDDLVAVIDALDLRNSVLIGHSMGGDVIVEAALRLPNRVAALVWVDTYRTLGKPDTQEETEAFIDVFRRDFVGATRDFVRRMSSPSSDPDLVEWIAADMSAAPREIALGALEHAVTNEDAILAALPNIAASVLAINPADRPNDIEALQRHGVKTMLVSGVGHFLMMEDPDSFNGLLAKTIEEFA